MLKVGITGGIGSGKTTVCNIFKRLGVPVFDADTEAKSLLYDEQVKIQIIQLCGKEILTPENSIDRKKMAQVIFSNPKILQKVNSIIHPIVKNNFIHWTELHFQNHFVIEEAALIFESSAKKDLDFTILVHSPFEIRVQRVMERDKVSRGHVLSRIKNQMPEEDKIKLADFIIENDEQHLIIPQVLSLYEKFTNFTK